MTHEIDSFRSQKLLSTGRRVEGRLRVPSSKSVTHRMLLLALLAGRSITLERPLFADDTRCMMAALKSLGWQMHSLGDALELQPPVAPVEEAVIDCGAAGTMLRMLCGVLTVTPGRFRLDGVPRLRERPIAPLVDALRALGGCIEYLGEEGFAPVQVTGLGLQGGVVELDAGESSQYVSALLLAASKASAPVRVRVREVVSAPYIDLTLEALARFGATASVESDGFRVEPGLDPPLSLPVEGDFSAAAYPVAAAALLGGTVVLEGLRADSAQGDRRFLELLETMGAQVEWSSDALKLVGDGTLAAVDVDLSSMPDQVPTLAALAPFASGTTRIRNVAHLRLKESDRLAVMGRELERVGARVEVMQDGLSIEGCWALTNPPISPVTVDPENDHRIAMSMALVGLRRPGLTIANPVVVEKSYPGFWTDLDRLLS
jgi:3-phosphoshikimate 1-carboxyvinyltransferase